MAEAATTDAWDICFLAYDAARKHLLDWSRPYLQIEAAFAGKSPVPDLADVDRKGVTILSASATAYDLHLSRSLQQATLIPAKTVAESHARFRTGEADFVAGVRASLEAEFGRDEGIAIMQKPFASVGQTIAVPRAKAGFVPALNAFLDRQGVA
jgi:polar amino acid transport system substrate-binding protein